MDIINGKIYTMEGEIIENGFLRMNGSIIQNIGTMSEYKQEEAEVYDAEGNYVLPGMVEGHCHLSCSVYDITDSADPFTPQMSIADSINPLSEDFVCALDAGITSGVVLPGSENIISGYGAAVKFYGNTLEKMLIKEKSVMKMALGTNPTECHGRQFGRSPYTRMGTAALIREFFRKSIEYSQKRKEGKTEYNRILEAMLPVINKEIPLHIHAHRSDDIMTGIRLTKEFGLRCVIVHATGGSRVAEEISREKIPVIAGPILFTNCKPEMEEGVPENAYLMHRAGVRVGFGTDAQVIRAEELPGCAAVSVDYGMDEMEALKGITIYNAEMIGIDDRVGSLHAGKDADIIITDQLPTRYGYRLKAAWVNGILVRNNR